MSDSKDDKKLLRFMGSYGGIESPQELASAVTDPQLNTLATTFAEKLSDSTTGTILDIGAGQGTVLARVAALPQFRAGKWEYCAVEDPTHHESLIRCAFEAGVHKRTEILALAQFYETWPLCSGRVIAVIRNVLHELNIQETAQLFSVLSHNLKAGDEVIIQDLSVFPIAERGNACWQSSKLDSALARCGFEVLSVPLVTRSGNGWFNTIAIRNEQAPPGSILEVIVSARTEQLQSMREAGALALSEEMGREARIAKADYDLQYNALRNQLEDAGGEVAQLTRRQGQLIAREALADVFQRAEVLISEPNSVPSIVYFKDRANNQGTLQAFLEGPETVTCISGPTSMGKTTLVRHVLSTFKHGRFIIDIDLRSSTTPWTLTESLLSEIGSPLPSASLGRLQHMDTAQLFSAMEGFFRANASNMVIVFDHFERVLAPDNNIASLELKMMIERLSALPLIKVIITSRFGPLPVTVLSKVRVSQNHPPVGRFPRGGHVHNLLGHFVGRTKFPESLLEAIDRHPYAAWLAGRIIEEHGSEAITEEFLQQLNGRLRDNLLAKIATDLARTALEWIGFVRGRVPRVALELVAGKASVQEALDTGLIYAVSEPLGSEVLTCVGALRVKPSTRIGAEGQIVDDNIKYHHEWGDAYRRAYRADNDPRWLRESYYHHSLSGSRDFLARFAVTHLSEIQDAGEYWFRAAKKFEDALWAFGKVAEHSDPPTHHIRMRVASCNIRTGRAEQGKAEFLRLFADYPEWVGVRRSYVDGLLYLEEFQVALDFIEKNFPFDDCQDMFIMTQYGRAYLGLHRFLDAEKAFKARLSFGDDAYTYTQLGQVYRRLGRREDEGYILRRAYAKFRDSKRIAVSYAAWLEANDDPSKALEILRPLINEDPLNARLGFAYTKSLIRSGTVEPAAKPNFLQEAAAYYEGHGRYSFPVFLRSPILAMIRRGEGRYQDAVRALERDDHQESRDPSHVQGQLCEIYLEWASTLENGQAVARNALLGREFVAHNLPLNVSVAKLCIVADDVERFNDTILKCQGINGSARDVIAVLETGREKWGKDVRSVS